MIRIKGASDKENLEITKDFRRYQESLYNVYDKCDNRSGVDFKNVDSIWQKENKNAVN